MTTKEVIAPETIAHELDLLGQAIEVVQTNDADDLIALAVTEMNKASVSIARAGFYLLNLKSVVGHGEFETSIKAHGIAGQRAREAMKVAQALMALPPATAKKLIHMPKAKTVELSKIDPDDLDRLTQSGELDEIATMSRDDLRDYVRSLQNKNTNLSTQLETEQLKARELKKQMSGRQANSEYPDFVELVRHESTALTNKIDICTDDLSRLFQELADIENMSTKQDADFARFVTIAKSTLYHNIAGALAKFESLTNEVYSTYGDDIALSVDPVYFFSDAEALAAIDNRQLLIAEHKQEALIRENERELRKPRGRGRPATKKKARKQ